MKRSVWAQYGISVLAVGLALSLKLLLVPLVTQDAPFQLFFLAVMVAAWYGGLGPGLLAMGLAAIFDDYFFTAPFYDFELSAPGAAARLTLFLIEGICISIICAKLQAARHRAEESEADARELERRILEISDAEQRRIGHDLHDGLGQHLTGIALMTKQLEHRLTVENSTYAARADKILKLAEKAVEWTHDLSRSLSTPALETQGLTEALQELVTNAENLFGIECTYEQTGEVALRDLTATVHLFRIVQEAISNAVKHGQAKRVLVRLSRLGDDVSIQIADNGLGIEPAEEPQDGMGLRIMRYRARMIGAQIDVQHGNGRAENQGEQRGTLVTCRYQLPPGERSTQQ